MKFGVLKIGAMFSLDGDTYVKTSPMIGLNKSSGAQKFMRRSVEVEPRGAELETEPAAKTRVLTRARVEKAFSEFYATCEQCLQVLASHADERSVVNMQKQLEKAKQKFIQKIS